ncbi:hypothetical protein SAMN02745824_0541 [Parasphingorhabdus marina DSM 22363]|uniref:Uncharacterized protein n=1 Tax=Parasphingorhabdus marina DSM 22363 TaxID=1123272 RepID=A0A1N6CN43_9SPHN|nr:DUF6768 family protein [Parasphingorhabdus marina]SIN60001.1 hypothetical protein SAMN02745824_0541 [Parasphingorhabdus marina DSM 22363]
MTKFDNDLGAALAAEDREFLEDLENGRGLFDQLGATLQGPMRFWSYLITVVTFLWFCVAIYAGWRALEAVELRETVLWAAGFLLSFQAVGLMKMWMFDRMNLLSLLAEMKRIELRVAQLSERQG